MTGSDATRGPAAVPQDVCVALRGLRRDRGFTLTVATLPRIGANTTRFALADALRPALGRRLTVDDGRERSPHVAVLTFDTWRRDFGGRTNVHPISALRGE